MNAPTPEVHLRSPAAQEDLPLTTPGVYRVVWESRFGPMLIEVADGAVYVNGERVDPAANAGPEAQRS